MKQQVVFIHGGETRENYKHFFDFLDKLEYEPFKEEEKKWKHTFKEDLGDDFEVFNPTMPNKDFADYEEWKVMFEKVVPFLKDEVILVGHSLGGTFFTKYLNENELPVKIKNLLIVAGAFNDGIDEVLGSFNFDKDLNIFKKYENKIIFYQSRDDTIVPFTDLQDFRKRLPNSKYIIFNDRFHFVDETFPELIKDIKKIK